ncbi:transferase [Podospora didyma]|uniref:Transferase n=1 Tax=Podospora didyma TaxID=330526 RepID=A0AAE0K9K8_9PEZI|nr:transferase [Podospora didyma]
MIASLSCQNVQTLISQYFPDFHSSSIFLDLNFKSITMPPPTPFEVAVTGTQRVQPFTPPRTKQITPLSLLDATTANFALTNAIWLFPSSSSPVSGLVDHLAQSLRQTLNAYPHFCGQCHSIASLDGGATDPETKAILPPHAQRFGRIYAHYGTTADPGVEFTVATCASTLDEIYPSTRTKTKPVWHGAELLKAFSPTSAIANTLDPPSPADDRDITKIQPLLAIQLTELACGGFILAAKAAHPIADIASLAHFVKNWAFISRSTLLAGCQTSHELQQDPGPVPEPVFDPSLLDNLAAGDINSPLPDSDILPRAKEMPFHRYDWWAASKNAPSWATAVPSAFQNQALEPAGDVMPWDEWDMKAPVASCIIHLTHSQIEYLYQKAAGGEGEEEKGASPRLSKHDAVLAHIWSCIVRARQLSSSTEPVHCDLVLGLRPALHLPESFIGSPTLMMKIELPASKIADGDLELVGRRIRETITAASSKPGLRAHLHGVAYEKSPQRIWQGFLGRKHIMVTTWARAGIYAVDFGLGAGSEAKYADGVVPPMDGCVLIKEAPPLGTEAGSEEREVGGRRVGWTDNGVDVSVHLRAEDMERLVKDPLFLPECT